MKRSIGLLAKGVLPARWKLIVSTVRIIDFAFPAPGRYQVSLVADGELICATNGRHRHEGDVTMKSGQQDKPHGADSGFDSWDCVDLVLDGPGDKTVRPIRPALMKFAVADRDKMERWRQLHTDTGPESGAANGSAIEGALRKGNKPLPILERTHHSYSCLGSRCRGQTVFCTSCLRGCPDRTRADRPRVGRRRLGLEDGLARYERQGVGLIKHCLRPASASRATHSPVDRWR